MRKQIKDLITFIGIMMMLIGGAGMDSEDQMIPVVIAATGILILIIIGLIGGIEEYEEV